MRLRHWLATALSLGFLLSAPTFVFAEDAAPADQGQTQAAEPAKAAAPKENLPQTCVDAGIDNARQCKAFLAKAEGDKAAADKAAAEKAAADKAAAAQAEKAAADKAAADNAAAEKAAAAQKAAADKAAAGQAAAEKAAADKAAAAKAAADKVVPAADNAPAANAPAADQNQKPKRVRLPKDCTAAGITTKEDCDAFHASNAKPQQLQNEQAPAANAAPVSPKGKPAPDSNAAAQPAANPPADQNGRPQHLRLAKDCVAAGITTKEDCDALHAINTQKGKGPAPAEQPAAAAPAAEAPANGKPAPADQNAGPAPAANGVLPAEVTPAKPETAEKPAAKPTPEADTLPDITKGLDAAAKSYNKAVAALGQPDQADKARAEIKAQQGKIDALCKTNKFDSTAQCLAQYGVQLAPIPASEAPGGQAIVVKPVQPVEVIPNLPKGVSQQDVAPLLDSAKDQDTGKGPAPKPAGEGQPPAAVSNAPPPANDKAAQADLKPVKVVPIDQTKGQQIEAGATAPQVQVPQNVTIINQTTVNNTTVNNTTNNTNVTNNQQNNNGPGVQQNNGAPGNQQAGRPGNGRPGFPGNGPGRPGRPGFPGNNEPPNPIGLGIGIILQLGNQLIINSPAQDQQRIGGRPDDRTTYENLPGNRYRETITRPDGVRIVTIYNRNGDILRRSRFDRNGHEIVLAYFDSQHDQDLLDWRDPGQDLPPLRLHIPARDYVLDADGADEADVQQFFAQPPVEQVQRLYSIDEVKRSARIRDMVRRLEIGDLTFDTGAATISEDQVGNLSTVANAMLGLLRRNPAETFLIEGHTDAVGSEIANLQLSDARAATVAGILTDFYHIPPENLATQGYGERFLKVQTDGPERLNRRVTIRRITPLVTVANQNY